MPAASEASNGDDGAAHVNGSLHHTVPPTMQAQKRQRKEDSQFALQSSWHDLPCDDQVYGKNTLGCSDNEWRCRVDLAAVYRLCHKHGLNEGVNNHLTAMIPGQQDRFLVFPFGLMWSEVTASNLLVVSGTGKVITGKGQPETTAFHIHAPIHKRHPEGMCILHTHQTQATAIACLEDPEVLMMHQNSLRFYKDVAYELDYNALVTSEQEGNHLADVMGPRHVLMMQNHGVIVAAKSISQAWNWLYYLERAAAVQLKALATGKKIHIVPDHVCEDWKHTFAKVDNEYSRLFLEAAKRELLRSDDKDFIL